ncbi:UNVERIFIED_CONTAM: hypothetical protein K2H54_063451 [Gekko kuhli]
MSNIVKMLRSSSRPLWVDICNDLLYPDSLEDMIWSAESSSKEGDGSMDLLYSSIHCWKKSAKNLLPGLSQYSTFLNQTWFLPGTDLNLVKNWRSWKVCYIIGTATKHGILSKIEL